MADSDIVMSELLTAGPSMASVLEPLVNLLCTQSELILTVTSCSGKEREEPARDACVVSQQCPITLDDLYIFIARNEHFHRRK